MDASARSIHSPRARPRMSAWNSTPVPRGLVRMSRSPGARPPTRISGAASSARPNTAKPATSSGPVVVWPPTSVTCSASSAARAPDKTWYSDSSACSGAVSGTDTCARAKRGATPLAQRSLVALTAATRPTRYGSSVKARKLSTLDTITSPPGVADGRHVVALVQAEQDGGIDGRADSLEGPGQHGLADLGRAASAEHLVPRRPSSPGP